MTATELLKEKTIKPKEKTFLLSKLILEGSLTSGELMEIANTSGDPIKATCIEALEFATLKNPHIIDQNLVHFIVESINAKAPRVKWESAKVITNIAHLYPNDLEQAIENLLLNAKHKGTVVRWSAANALRAITALKSQHNVDLLLQMEILCENEEKDSIRKIYQDALKRHA